MTEQTPPCDSPEGQAGAEIEVSPAMIEAGLDALWSLDAEEDGGRAIVVAVYSAMCAAVQRNISTILEASSAKRTSVSGTNSPSNSTGSV